MSHGWQFPLLFVELGDQLGVCIAHSYFLLDLGDHMRVFIFMTSTFQSQDYVCTMFSFSLIKLLPYDSSNFPVSCVLPINQNFNQHVGRDPTYTFKARHWLEEYWETHRSRLLALSLLME